MANPPTTAELSQDALFTILSVKRRRDALTFLDEREGESSIGVVAEHVAVRENGVEPHQLTGDQRNRVMISLYQHHLPKMDDLNVIDYDQRGGTIELREEAEEVLSYIAFEPSETSTVDPGGKIMGSNPGGKLRAKLATWTSG